MRSLFQEFKAFLQRGNVIDLAVAFVLGTAFSGVVSALVTDIIMPPIGLILGKVDFSNLFLVLRQGQLRSIPNARGRPKGWGGDP